MALLIRKGTDEDIPAIVTLLKNSLGESSSTKSIDYWKWKHIDNPFGKSPVLVAEEKGQLIGVRAMMQWQWTMRGKTYRSLRAVDTATHPDHQGKGIFKKLTLELIDLAGQEGYDFIFNTPNSQSQPGYLKMGWQVWGKVPIWLRPVLFSKSGFSESFFQTLQQQNSQSEIHEIPLPDNSTGLHTAISHDFLQWRYFNCPVKPYVLFKSAPGGKKIWMFVTIKPRPFGFELRVCHWFLEEGGTIAELLHEAVRLACTLGCKLVSIGGLQEQPFYQLIRHCFSPADMFSLTLTVRSLSETSATDFLYKEPWILNTGDIELF